MDLKFTSSSETGSFKARLSRSTVFDATIEQAEIAMHKSRPNREVLNLQRESGSLRSSYTYSSTLFLPPEDPKHKDNIYKPKDNITLRYFGNDDDSFYRKSITSDFSPNFQPKFAYGAAWAVDKETFLKAQPEKTKLQENSWIKPISKDQKIPAGMSSYRAHATPKPRASKNLQCSESIEDLKIVPCLSRSTRNCHTSSRSVSGDKLMPISIQNLSYKRHKFLQLKSVRDNSKVPFKLVSRSATPQVYKDKNTLHPDTTFEFLKMNLEENPTNQIVNNELIENTKPINSSHGKNKSIVTIETQESDSSAFQHIDSNTYRESRQDKRQKTPNKKQAAEYNNYALIIDAWKENKIGLADGFYTERRSQPSYMKKTISSISKSRKII
ncbi:hypothetical protein SteCoe_5974 [Stentor coeruleus]|uniref:Uncharacterized protein n=1 Tax=Stentor coeruleus TaxID=5963 RepID=A0A1R2CR48_9CILI|nr:hypothetical protein SteCoe_5974 [Stentor coeruleus]